jgi:hypothetical protein
VRSALCAVPHDLQRRGNGRQHALAQFTTGFVRADVHRLQKCDRIVAPRQAGLVLERLIPGAQFARPRNPGEPRLPLFCLVQIALRHGHI